MGRPPCSQKFGVKKGPWTPEEDVILVSYIQEHGPGNWRSVPTNTGLMRCSKSCRLRWANYLRPGIKRGNFTDHEDKVIIHLQALLGNRYLLPSYLPRRTDNDIKNYWNTHLKKQLNKSQTEDGNGQEGQYSSSTSQPRGQWERRLQTDIQKAKQALSEALSLDKPTHNILPEADPSNNNDSSCHTSSYASSYENISQLLENWMKSPKSGESNSENMMVITTGSSSNSEAAQSTTTDHAFDFLLSFKSDGNGGGGGGGVVFQDQNSEVQVPFTLLEKWLFDDEAAAQCHDEDLVNISLEESTTGLF